MKTSVPGLWSQIPFPSTFVPVADIPNKKLFYIVGDTMATSSSTYLLGLDYGLGHDEDVFTQVPFKVRTFSKSPSRLLFQSLGVQPNGLDFYSWGSTSTLNTAFGKRLSFPTQTFVPRAIRIVPHGAAGTNFALLPVTDLSMRAGLGQFGWFVLDDSLQWVRKRSVDIGTFKIGSLGGKFQTNTNRFVVAGTSRMNAVSPMFGIIVRTDTLGDKPERVIRLRKASGQDLKLNQVAECSQGMLFWGEGRPATMVMMNHDLSQVIWAKSVPPGLSSPHLLSAPAEGPGNLLYGTAMVYDSVFGYWPLPGMAYYENWACYGLDIATGEPVFMRKLQSYYGGVGSSLNKTLFPVNFQDGKMRLPSYGSDANSSWFNNFDIDSLGNDACGLLPVSFPLNSESLILDTLTTWSIDTLGDGNLLPMITQNFGFTTGQLIDTICDCHPRVQILATPTSFMTYQFEVPNQAGDNNWSFGDGTSITAASPTHTYANPGTYIIEMCRDFGCGMVCDYDTLVIECPIPQMNFGYAINNLTVSLQHPYSLGYAYYWNFGDGSYQTGAFPTHTFSQAGTYNICLTYANGCGYDSICSVITVPCSNLVSSFSHSANAAMISFNSTMVTGASHSWAFGDGSTSNAISPQHFYLSSGTYNVCHTVTNSCGSNTSCQVITVTCQQPVSSFTKSVSGLVVSFNSTSTFQGPVNYLWNFGDGTTSTAQNPVHTYLVAGAYNACLLISNTCGGSTSCTSVVTNCSLPVNAFSHTSNLLQVNFSNTSAGATSRVWDFGDGTTATVLNPAHLYAQAGTYNVCLTSTNACGNTTSCQTITVVCPLPVAGFSHAANNLSVQFTNTSTGANSSTWHFGDGTNSNLGSPMHVFPGPGTYNVCLISSNSCGADSTCFSLSLTCPNPNSAFGSTANLLAVSFSNMSSGATAQLWDFGDGTTTTLANPNHTYSAAGTYTVCLNSSNGCGNDTACQSLTLTCPLPTSAFFSASNHLQASFTNNSTGSNSSFWDFGDGTFSAQNSPTHTYTAPGTYQVCLSSQNSCGTVNSCQSLTVTCPLPVSAFGSMSNQLTVTFNNQSTDANTRIWKFGDGNTSTALSPVHVYASPGNYNVCLVSINACGADTTCNTVSVTCPAPMTSFSANANLLSVSFNNGSSGANSRLWDFGDGNTSTVASPLHSYAAPGTYNVCLYNTNICGVDTLCQSITVVCPTPVSAFSTTTNQLTATFSNSSSGAISRVWDFGNGQSSNAASPTYTYPQPGTYMVCLISINSCGSDTICNTVTVTCPVPSTAFSTSTNLLDVNFTNSSSGTSSQTWDFGDGQSSTSTAPNHTYAQPGSYTVCLINTNPCGSDTLCQVVTVVCPTPASGFSAAINGSAVSFGNSSTGATASMWDFGDGQFSNQNAPTHTYAQPGTYLVCLTSTNTCGSDSMCQTITIACPVVSAQIQTSGQLPTVQFNANTSGGATFYHWDFGDGQTSNNAAPQHTYAVVDSYTVCLTAWSECDTATTCIGLSSATGTVTAISGFEWMVYPQPANDRAFLRIQMDVETEVALNVYDAVGRQILNRVLPTSKDQVHELDASSWANGVYYIELEIDGTRMGRKFFVRH